MRPIALILLVLAVLSVGFAQEEAAENCRRTKCHTHSSQNECNEWNSGDEYVAKWGYCWGVAGKWESCCKKSQDYEPSLDTKL